MTLILLPVISYLLPVTYMIILTLIPLVPYDSITLDYRTILLTLVPVTPLT